MLLETKVAVLVPEQHDIPTRPLSPNEVLRIWVEFFLQFSNRFIQRDRVSS